MSRQSVDALIASRLPLVFNKNKDAEWHYQMVLNYVPRKIRDVERFESHKVFLERQKDYALTFIARWIDKRVSPVAPPKNRSPQARKKRKEARASHRKHLRIFLDKIKTEIAKLTPR